MLNEEGEQQTKTQGSPKINTESSRRGGGWLKGLGGVHACVWECARVQDKSGHPPLPPLPLPRNISKIATANQTECKSALWKGLKKKSFEGRRKTGIHFSPFTVPGAQKWVTALQLHSDCWNRTPGFIFSSNELQVFPPAEAQLYYSSWKLHHAQGWRNSTRKQSRIELFNCISMFQ